MAHFCDGVSVRVARAMIATDLFTLITRARLVCVGKLAV